MVTRTLSSTSSIVMTVVKGDVNKTRAPEFYGFVAWASTSALFVVYILWALLPDEWIVALGVNWYPSRCVFRRARIQVQLS